MTRLNRGFDKTCGRNDGLGEMGGVFSARLSVGGIRSDISFLTNIFTLRVIFFPFPLHLHILSVIILDGTKYSRRGLAAPVPVTVGGVYKRRWKNKGGYFLWQLSQ